MKTPSSSKVACLAVLWIGLSAAALGQTFTTLAEFNATDGSAPGPVIQGTDGNFYGVTSFGGQFSQGAVFRITPDGTITTLHSFCQQSGCPDGNYPNGSLVQASDGNFYGATYFQGAANSTFGTIFRITPTGTLTTIYAFCPGQVGCPDGQFPNGGLVQGSDGNLYGTTQHTEGGQGTVFRITLDGTLTTLYTFCTKTGCPDGGAIFGGLTLGKDGNFYGTTVFGGAFSKVFGGTVFKITPAGNVTTLHSFCAQKSGVVCLDGSEPWNGALVQASDGNFYGTTSSGGGNVCPLSGNGCGTAFRITPGGKLTTLHVFCSDVNSNGRCTDGAAPSSGMIVGSDGNLYGTTTTGGTGVYSTSKCSNTAHEGCGTLYSMSTAGSLNTLYNFCSITGCADGTGGNSLIVSGDTLYGSTSGGTSSTGTVFSFSTSVALAPTFTPPAISFGNEALDTTSKVRSVMIKNVNTGSATLDFTGFKLSGSADFAITANTCGATLAAGKSCKVSLTYRPAALGAASATLSVSDNAPGSPQTVALAGTGVSQATLAPTTLAFGTHKVGSTSAARIVTLKNNLPTTLTGIAYSTKAPFAVSASTCTATLASGKSCTISVTFSPAATGAVTGTLSVTDNANDSPQKATLTGTGD